MTPRISTQIEETVDLIAAWCGISRPHTGARAVRSAVRALGSDRTESRIEAERILHADRRRSLPALREAAHARTTPRRAIHAAVLLHRIEPHEGAPLLRSLARDPYVRSSAGAEDLRRGLAESGAAEHFLAQVRSNLLLLEQMRDSFRTITRFKQSLEVLRFLDVPVPPEIARRALCVRTVGGENLDMVRHALRPVADASLEHICLARKEMVDTLVHGVNRQRAFPLLVHGLKYPNSGVRLTALYGLEQLADVRATPLVRAIARNSSDPLARDARRVLASLPRRHADATTLLRAAAGGTTLPAEMLRPAVTDSEAERRMLPRVPH
jgi:hypothetical protein